MAVSAETVGGANRVLKERYFEGKSGVTGKEKGFFRRGGWRFGGGDVFLAKESSFAAREIF